MHIPATFLTHASEVKTLNLKVSKWAVSDDRAARHLDCRPPNSDLLFVNLAFYIKLTLDSFLFFFSPLRQKPGEEGFLP